ncbi:spherulin-1A [Macrophomina phaseolina]|uniref:Spherulin-1A n=1 Tax=Macrophomina phaseolina TaxID=35725 RepID=A0ABQ8GUN2_9PEZI|nr:spherulin-1A [Macrophomina phaseolina]
MSSKISLFLGLLAAGLHRVTAVDQVVNAQLVDQTKLAATRLERLKLFPADNDTLFDFYSQPNFTWEPGSVVNMNTATFPYVTGNRMTLALLNLGPCSMLPPHYHPRAANFVVAVNGTTDTYMIEENGARTVTVTLTAGKATIFPMASIHMMENKGCEPAQLVSALNSEDTGTVNIANALFDWLPATLVAPAVGYGPADLNGTAKAVPPVGTGSIFGRKDCLARCAKAGYKVYGST